MSPVRSAKQQRYVYSQAAAGKPWARRFLRDSGLPQPDRRKRKHKRSMLEHVAEQRSAAGARAKGGTR